MKNVKQEKNTEGITLVALVVTIVVLLILAGVSLNLVIGQNGLIQKAKDAKSKTEQARTDEDRDMSDLSDWVDQTLQGNGGNGGSGTGDETQNELPTIPSGFYYVGGKKNSGVVISDNAEDENKYKDLDVVGTDLQGNQFVWIPVDNIANYKRTLYGVYENEEGTLADFSETLPEDEKESINKYKGFYIGRYEAGDEENTKNKTSRSWPNSSVENSITIKANQTPYNYIKQLDAKKLAEGFSTKKGYTAKTKLVSSYAWDTAIAFIENNSANSNYGTSSPEGNYSDVEDLTYTDIEGIQQTKETGQYDIIPTGQTTPVCNIYDMGGNVWSWTTESNYTIRGGGYLNSYTIGAGIRYSYFDNADPSWGFRLTLFM